MQTRATRSWKLSWRSSPAQSVGVTLTHSYHGLRMASQNLALQAQVLELTLPASFADYLLYCVRVLALELALTLMESADRLQSRLYRSMNSDGALPLILVSFTVLGLIWTSQQKLFPRGTVTGRPDCRPLCGSWLRSCSSPPPRLCWSKRVSSSALSPRS